MTIEGLRPLGFEVVGRYVAHFVKYHQQLLIAADLTPFKNPFLPLCPRSIVCEIHSDAGLGLHALWLSVSQVVPYRPIGRGKGDKL